MKKIASIALLSATLLGAAVTGGGEAPAAERFDSAYTKIDLNACPYTPPASPEGTDGGRWTCAGYEGIPVHVAEGDLRMFVSFGANAADEPAAGQTLPQFNTINETLEWRLVSDGGGWRPFATILRWFPETADAVSGQSVTGQVLVVTRLGAGETCQVARIDAAAVRNANERAREIADTRARAFDCATDPIVELRR